MINSRDGIGFSYFSASRVACGSVDRLEDAPETGAEGENATSSAEGFFVRAGCFAITAWALRFC